MRGLFIILVLLPVFSYSQLKQLIKACQTDFKLTEHQPELQVLTEKGMEIFFSGCNEQDAVVNRNEWEAYLFNNLVLDDESLGIIPPGIYTVRASFIISKEGKMSDVAIIKDPGYELGERVKKALQKYKGIGSPQNSMEGQF